jgi:hypothetical protein
LPGPNVIGYWFVYRTVCHGLALIGVRRARRREVVTELESSRVLDLPIEESGPRAVDRLADSCGLKRLEVFLVRVGAAPASGTGTGAAAGDVPVGIGGG